MTTTSKVIQMFIEQLCFFNDHGCLERIKERLTFGWVFKMNKQVRNRETENILVRGKDSKSCRNGRGGEYRKEY